MSRQPDREGKRYVACTCWNNVVWLSSLRPCTIRNNKWKRFKGVGINGFFVVLVFVAMRPRPPAVPATLQQIGGSVAQISFLQNYAAKLVNSLNDVLIIEFGHLLTWKTSHSLYSTHYFSSAWHPYDPSWANHLALLGPVEVLSILFKGIYTT